MKKMNLLVLSAAIAGALVSGAAAADVTANIGATSNYLWRGNSESNEAAAISGGVDYSHASGGYAGIWISSEGSTSGETDIYVGYAGEASGVSYDVGYVSYMYNQDPDGLADGGDFEEVVATIGYGPVSLFLANNSDLATDKTYMAITGEHGIYSLTYGSQGDYSHFDLGFALTDELSLVYSSNDNTDASGDGRFVISYGLEFDFK